MKNITINSFCKSDKREVIGRNENKIDLIFHIFWSIVVIIKSNDQIVNC